jgi:hypothetical protein
MAGLSAAEMAWGENQSRTAATENAHAQVTPILRAATIRRIMT